MMLEYKKTQLRLNLLEFLVLASTSAASYLAMILGDSGLDSGQVGIILSINAFIGMVAPPVFGFIADKIGSPRKALSITLIMTAILWTGIPLSVGVKLGTFPLVVLFVLLGSLSRTPIGSLLDSWIMQVQESDPRILYARARKYGSLGFSVMAIVSTPIVAQFGEGAAFFTMPILLLPILFLARQVGDPSPQKAELPAGGDAVSKPKGLQISRIFKNYYLMTHFLCLMVTWMPFMLHSFLLPKLIADIGQNTSLLGTVVGIRALMEVPAFMLVPFLCRKFNPRIFIPLGFLWYVVEYLLLSVTRSIVPLYLIMMMSGTIFAFIVGVNMNYIHGLAPQGLKATVVTMNGAAMSLCGIVANPLAGYLLKAVGIRPSFTIIAGMVFLVVCLMALFQYIGKKRNIQVPR